MHYVYLLQSKPNKKLYFGVTNNLQRRLQEHNSGNELATKREEEWELVYFEGYSSETDARKREKNLKYFGKAYSQLKQKIGNSLQSG